MSALCLGRRHLLAAGCLVVVLLYLALWPGNPSGPHQYVNFTVRKRVADLLQGRRQVGAPVPGPQASTGLVEHFGAAADHTARVVHIAAVSCGSNIAGVLNLIKSAALFNDNGSIHFHVFSDSSSEGALYKQFSSVSLLLSNRLLAIDLHRVYYPVRADAELWKNTFKPCATARLFLPTLLPNITSVIYMDTDTLFFVPPKDLWVQFDGMYSTHLVAMAPYAGYSRFARHPFVGELGVNSGVMLMHLERMRERKTNWTSTMEAIFHRYYKVLTWGDQDILKIFFHFHQDKLQLLPCEWNFRQKHCARRGACRSAEVTGVKVLHGNGGSFFHGMQLEFQAIYGAFNRHTLRDVMENRDFIKQQVVAELSQDPRISGGPSQCYGDAIRKTVLSLVSSF